MFEAEKYCGVDIKMGGKRKKGGEWTARVFYDSESAGSGMTYTIADSDLVDTLERLCDLSERIDAVRTYRTPLSNWQLTQVLFHHEFALFNPHTYGFGQSKRMEKGYTYKGATRFGTFATDSTEILGQQVGGATKWQAIECAANQPTIPRYVIW